MIRCFPIIVVVSLLAGCTSSSDPVPQSRYVATELPAGGLGLYVEGKLARKRGDVDRAARLYEQAAAADTSLILVNRELGELARQDNELSTAERWFRRLVERDVETTANYVSLGDTIEAAGRLPEALVTYQAGLAYAESDFGANIGAGRVLVAMDRHDEALPYLQSAVAADEVSGEAVALLGRALDATGQLRQAADAYTRAIELLPADADGRYDLLLLSGTNAARREQTALAIDRLRQAEKLRPGDPEPPLAIGLALTAEAERQRAMGVTDAARRTLTDAVRSLDVAVERAPREPRALNAAGSAKLRLWDAGGRLEQRLVDEAVQVWQKSLQIDPDQAAVRGAIERFAGKAD